jgi:hypothetical protein
MFWPEQKPTVRKLRTHLGSVRWGQDKFMALFKWYGYQDYHLQHARNPVIPLLSLFLFALFLRIPPLCQVFSSLLSYANLLVQGFCLLTHALARKKKGFLVIHCAFVSLQLVFSFQRILIFELVGRLSEWFWFFSLRRWSCAKNEGGFCKN